MEGEWVQRAKGRFKEDQQDPMYARGPKGTASTPRDQRVRLRMALYAQVG